MKKMKCLEHVTRPSVISEPTQVKLWPYPEMLDLAATNTLAYSPGTLAEKRKKVLQHWPKVIYFIPRVRYGAEIILDKVKVIGLEFT